MSSHRKHLFCQTARRPVTGLDCWPGVGESRGGARVICHRTDTRVSPAPSLCPKCVPVEGIQDYSRTLGLNDGVSIMGCCTSTYASLAIPRTRSQNPGVGGSIPSLPTIFPCLP